MKEYVSSRVDDRVDVRFIGHVDRRRLRTFYQEAYMCVVPSLWENLPYTCLEPMACGTPVIGSHSGGIPEIIEDGKSGILVTPCDASSLGEALLRMLRSRDLRDELGRGARVRIEEGFTRSVFAQKMTGFYNQYMKPDVPQRRT